MLCVRRTPPPFPFPPFPRLSVSSTANLTPPPPAARIAQRVAERQARITALFQEAVHLAAQIDMPVAAVSNILSQADSIEAYTARVLAATSPPASGPGDSSLRLVAEFEAEVARLNGRRAASSQRIQEVLGQVAALWTELGVQPDAGSFDWLLLQPGSPANGLPSEKLIAHLDQTHERLTLERDRLREQKTTLLRGIGRLWDALDVADPEREGILSSAGDLSPSSIAIVRARLCPSFLAPFPRLAWYRCRPSAPPPH